MSDRDAIVALMRQHHIATEDEERLLECFGVSWKEWNAIGSRVTFSDVLTLRSHAKLVSPIGSLHQLLEEAVGKTTWPFENMKACEDAIRALRKNMTELSSIEECNVARGAGPDSDDEESSRFSSARVVDTNTWLAYSKKDETLQMFVNRVNEQPENIRMISIISGKISRLWESPDNGITSADPHVPLLDLQIDDDQLLMLDLRGCNIDGSERNWVALRKILARFHRCTVVITHTRMGSVDSASYFRELAADVSTYDTLTRITWLYHQFLSAGGWITVFKNMPKDIVSLVTDSHVIVHSTMKHMIKLEITM